MDMNLGGLEENIQSITDLNFNVKIAGGPNNEDAEPGELRRDMIFGRWANKEVYAWLYDLGTGDSQLLARGFFDRDPTSINPGVFQVTVTVAPFVPTLPWPSYQIPSDTSEWDSNIHPTNNYKANVLVLNPDHAGKHMGPIFGDADQAQFFSADAMEVRFGTGNIPGSDWIWREIVPYGWNNAPLSSRYIFALAAIEPDCYVHDVVIQRLGTGTSDDATATLAPTRMEYVVLKQEDVNNGPIGTVVRFRVTLAGLYPNPFVWWMGPKCKVFARISGRNFGVVTSTTDGVPEYSLNTNPSPKYKVWNILEDIFSQPWYLRHALDELSPGLPARIWGSGALADFRATAPNIHGPDQDQWTSMACAVPVDITERPMSLREGLSTLAASFPFDIVQRYDDAVLDMRMYPIWRRGIGDVPDRVFTLGEMAKTDPPNITQLSDPNGEYGNAILNVTAKKYVQPLTITTMEASNSGVDQIDPTAKKQFTVNDIFEQSPSQAGATIPLDIELKEWHHEGDAGDSRASWNLGLERAQPQRVIQATHGVRSFGLDMGSTIQYDIVGVNRDVGMVRKMRFDYDRQVVQVTSLHTSHYSSVRSRANVDESYRGDTRRESPSDPEEEG
tara:strand:- start:2063 stop:3907 length:1845 start_codon:yes stop_codon:yes gene_type:complete